MTGRSIAIASLMGALACGCTGGDGNGANYGQGTTAEVGESAESMVTTAAGGAVMLESGAAGVSIPAGAMASDAVVTVEAIDPTDMPGLSQLASSVFEFGPDGTTFDIPVTLTMEIDRSAVPSGAEISMAWLNDGAWVELTDSQVNGNTVTATTTHFSVFALTFTIVDGHVVQTGGMCDPTSFSACGGDPTGVWTMADSCLSADINVGGDGDLGCDGASVSSDIDYTGTVTINAGGTYSTDLHVGVNASVNFPKSCLGNTTDCSALGPEAQDTGGACVINMSQSESTQDSGTWQTSGNTISLASDGDGPSSVEYCVSGNRMQLAVQEDGVNIIMVLMK